MAALSPNMRQRLTADDVRNIEEGAHLVVDLHPDEYWSMGEGHVEYVKEYGSGQTTVGLRGLRGHSCRLKIPSDARKGLTFTGAASGASNLRVERVERKD